MSFHVGQKVVCVDDSPTPLGWPVPFKLREVVTVAGFTITGCVCLSEYPNDVTLGFFAHRFRPLTDRSTDTGMAILRRILTDHKAPIREPAARVTAPVDHSNAPPS